MCWFFLLLISLFDNGGKNQVVVGFTRKKFVAAATATQNLLTWLYVDWSGAQLLASSLLRSIHSSQRSFGTDKPTSRRCRYRNIACAVAWKEKKRRRWWVYGNHWTLSISFNSINDRNIKERGFTTGNKRRPGIEIKVRQSRTGAEEYYRRFDRFAMETSKTHKDIREAKVLSAFEKVKGGGGELATERNSTWTNWRT